MFHFIKKQLNQLESFGADLIYDRRKKRGDWLLLQLLQSLSYLFSALVRLRYFLYETRLLKSRSLGCQVVVVGNLTLGGTGKTPIVEKFARTLAARGRKVAILSRGYKSKSCPFYKRFWRWMTHGEVEPPKVVSNGERVLLDSELAGDEPYMLASNLPGVVVLVDKDRVKAGRYAIEKFGADTLILDDGLQYLKLKGRLNLLLVDTTNPFGNGSLLPRGILREPIKHIKRASYVFLTKAKGKDYSQIRATIRKHNPTVEIIESAHQPQYLIPIHNADEASHNKIPLEKLRGKDIAAFSGIASPEGFEEYLQKQGGKLVYCQRYVDHYRFDSDELFLFFSRALSAGAKIAITTQKDAVRIPPGFIPPIPLYYLRLEIEILKGEADFEQAVAKISFPKDDEFK